WGWTRAKAPLWFGRLDDRAIVAGGISVFTKSVRSALFCATVFVAPVAVAHAQVLAQNTDEPGEHTRRTVRTIERGSEAAERQLPTGPRVTLEQVLAAPDDLELNYRFAQTQIADGDLRGAMSTLERILLTRPELA